VPGILSELSAACHPSHPILSGVSSSSNSEAVACTRFGETASERDAADLLRQMEERIGAGNQYFTDLKPLTVEGVGLFTVRSGPQSHYFWQTGKKVIWMGFDRDDPTELAIAVKELRWVVDGG